MKKIYYEKVGRRYAPVSEFQTIAGLTNVTLDKTYQ